MHLMISNHTAIIIVVPEIVHTKSGQEKKDQHHSAYCIYIMLSRVYATWHHAYKLNLSTCLTKLNFHTMNPIEQLGPARSPLLADLG
jgi:hypothetical protein